jgi:DNA invertase Pin-like site-specific DNA recombinase
LSAVPDKPSRVVLYARVSALMGRDGDNFHSPAVQVSAMRRITAGMREVAVIEDIDRTGRNFDREGIERIRSMAKLRQIDALAVYDVSRLGRNVRESLTFLAELADLGVTILSACEQVDTSTPAGRLMLTNMLAIAEYRSDEIGRSWSASIARRADQGRHHGRPIGYIRKDGKLQPDPIEGPAVTRAWLDYAAGVPVAKISRDLAAARGKPVRVSTVKAMFRRQAHLGHVVAGGQIVVENAHPALVDQATWDKVQLRLARDRVTPSRNLEATWSLVGISFCASCGSRLQRYPSRDRKGDVEQRLRCGGGTGRGVHGGCPGIGMPLLAAVEAEVLRRAGVYVSDLRADTGARAEALLRRSAAMADGRAVKRRLGNVTDGIARLAKAWPMGDLLDDEFHQATGELRDERDTLLERLAELGDTETRPTPEQFARLVDALLARWDEMSPQQRNRALRALVARVEVRRAEYWREKESKRLTITWR